MFFKKIIVHHDFLGCIYIVILVICPVCLGLFFLYTYCRYPAIKYYEYIKLIDNHIQSKPRITERVEKYNFTLSIKTRTR